MCGKTISKNRRGERKVKVILPDKKPYAYQESKRIRVAAYCRVSTAEEAQMNSFEMQVQHFEQVISENPMYEKADIYKDEGISGTSIEKRKDFQRMIEDCKAGKIDLILTKSISRFGRNIVDILSTLKLLDELTPPVAVTFESEGRPLYYGDYRGHAAKRRRTSDLGRGHVRQENDDGHRGKRQERDNTS